MRAEDLFPELFADKKVPLVSPAKARPLVVNVERRKSRGDAGIGSMPLPPDVSWLAGGLRRKTDREEEFRRQALVLLSDGQRQDYVISALSSLGFTATVTTDIKVGIAAVQNLTCCLVIADINDAMPIFHQRLLLFPMAIRRMFFYTLVGPKLRTMYGLEALSLSTNLVVNDRDLVYLDKILRKGFKEYDEQYRPWLEETRSSFPAFMG